MGPNRKKIALGTLVALETVAAALAWRDLASRTNDEVRGSKGLWRLFITLNPGNSLVYWAIGRRWRERPSTSPHSAAPAAAGPH